MSRADGEFCLPMSYPVDADELAFALHRAIERRRTRNRGQEGNYFHYASGSPHALCHCGRQRRAIEDTQIDIPEVQMAPFEEEFEMPFSELCKHILLANGYLLPIIMIMLFVFYLAMISIDK